ncbi:outer membrane protein assembly factor [Luteolibacter algae]|uniref:Outer membrane protein assembly factor n=1 Tax=Luteolibacter algae TaxID=454151 RepID=A0ABW5DAB2_9BACT
MKTYSEISQKMLYHTGHRQLCMFAAFIGMHCAVFAETEIEIEGLESKSEAQVLRLMGDRLIYVREKPASASRAHDAAFLMEQILREDGFNDVVISPQVLSSNRILLRVNEGRRLELGAVTIQGDAEGEEHEKLAELYATPAKADTPFGAGSAPFREEDVDTGLEFVTSELKSQGYWNAEAVLRKQTVNAETGAVDVELDIDKGRRFKIGRATVKSSDGRGVKRVATTAEPFTGQWATTENVNKLRAAMDEAFVSRGYPDAKILMNRRLVGSTYYPDFEIDLGVRVKLLKVEVTGLERTKPKRVRQIMSPLEDDWYDQAAMNKKVKALLGTGAFRSVRTETYEVAHKRINATLHFEEAKAKEISLSAGAGSFHGPLMRAVYTDRNFRGKLRSFSAGGEISGLGALGELKLTDPWWRGTDFSRTLRLYSLINGFEGYESFETGLESQWTWKATDHYTLSLLLGYSFVSVSSDGLPSAFLGETNYNHLRMNFTQTWDYRDNPILPKSGWHLNIPMEYGAVVASDSSTYTKLGLNGGWYQPLGEKYQLGIGGFASLVMPSGELRDLPVDLRVFNGGARSVRSFPERELGPSFNGDPYGGDFGWAVNTELSRSINGALRIVGFVDAGGVSGDYIGARQDGLELAAGLGLRLDLPIGPVTLEYGHNLTQDEAEPSGTWHFAIGTTF